MPCSSIAVASPASVARREARAVAHHVLSLIGPGAGWVGRSTPLGGRTRLHGQRSCILHGTPAEPPRRRGPRCSAGALRSVRAGAVWLRAAPAAEEEAPGVARDRRRVLRDHGLVRVVVQVQVRVRVRVRGVQGPDARRKARVCRAGEEGKRRRSSRTSTCSDACARASPRRFYSATTDVKTLADYNQLCVIVVDELTVTAVFGSRWRGSRRPRGATPGSSMRWRRTS